MRNVTMSTENGGKKDYYKINLERTIRYCNNAEKNSFGMSKNKEINKKIAKKI